MEITPLTKFEIKDRETVKIGNAVSGEADITELEKAAFEAIGKNFVKASEQAVTEALQKMGTSDKAGSTLNDSRPYSVEKEPGSDEVMLSKETSVYGRNREETESMVRRQEEAMADEWKSLEDWKIRPSMPFAQEILQLKEACQNLLRLIMNYYPEDSGKMQINHLNLLLYKILTEEAETRYPNLLAFLRQYGADRADEVLKLVLLKQVAGKTIRLQNRPEGTGTAFRQTGEQGRKTGYRESETRENAVQEGVLYYKGGKKEIYAARSFQKQLRSMEKNSVPFYTEADIKTVNKKNYQPVDMERAEKFLTYTNKEGNLIQKVRILAGREELVGYLLAENTYKAQIFQEYAGVDKSLGQEIRVAFQKLADYYLQGIYVKEEHDQNTTGNYPADIRQIRQIYYHVLQIFQKNREPQKALEKGLEFAVKEFDAEKEERPRTVKKEKQRRSFFKGLIDEDTPKKEWEKGKKELEKDWDRFLLSIGNENNEYLQWAYHSLSPWGILEEPRTQLKGGTFYSGLLFFLLLIGILVMVLLRML